jgi:hypothetical protein
VTTLVEPTGVRPAEQAAEALIKEARRRHRRRQCWVGATVALLVAGLAATATLKFGNGHPTPVATKSTQSPRFVPPTTTRNGRTTMAIRLPDGRGFAVSYPRSLDLARFGLTIGGEVDWPITSGRYSCCSEAATPYYGTAASLFAGKPLATYRGVHGTKVLYYSGAQTTLQNFYEPGYDYLVFTFGPWVVPLLDIGHTSYYTARMTDGERATWARSFDAHLTKGGYLVFAPRTPLHVSRGSMDIVLNGSDGSLEIGGPQSCTDTQAAPQIIPAGRAWCDPSAGVRLSVTGQSRFVDLASSGLVIRRLGPVH